MNADEKSLSGELDRLGIQLLTRGVKSGQHSFTLTEAQVAASLRRIAPGESGCWIWIGSRAPGGYGIASLWRADRGVKASVFAHRLMYQLTRGPIPVGLTLDHVCRTPPCVNPSHLDPCTQAENTARSPYALATIYKTRTHCKFGHLLDGVRHDSRGRPYRYCTECNRLKYRARKGATP